MAALDQAAPRTINTSPLGGQEQQMLQLAQQSVLTPGERRELLWYLDVTELPAPADRVQATVERILGDRDAGRS